jgi:K+:H+ antiporter
LDAITAEVIGDIALVIAVSSLLGAMARRFGQPKVIGQLLAGVVLGPSVLGRLPGHLTTHLFPVQVLPYLTILAQVAVVLFMFGVGYEIDLRGVRSQGLAVPLIAGSALGVPMALGIACVLVAHQEFAAIGAVHQGRSFVLFIGIAMAITALPVLAAIVRERGLAGTTAGNVAVTAAGVMDVLAWLALAVALIGSGHSGPLPLPAMLLAMSCFAVIMITLVPPALSWWKSRSKAIFYSPVPVAFVLAMGSAWITASIGLHPVFGGFLAGLAMRGRNSTPDADLLRSMNQTGNVLLPLFFVVTGLSLNIGAMRGDALVVLALVFVVAVAGKLVPAYASARIARIAQRDSAAIAVLVNTRGLTELIALNVGLTAGLIDQRLFTVLVLMALLTTVMTGPLLSLVQPSREPRPAVEERSAA